MSDLPLSQRALPPDKRTPAPPPPFEKTLPSGQWCQWRMPDPLKIIAFSGAIPDALTAKTITLLKQEKSYQDDKDPRQLMYDAQAIEGMYALIEHMLVWPSFDPRREYGAGDTLGRRELGYLDVVSLYLEFRVGTRIIARLPARADESQWLAEPARDSGDLRTDASAADGHHGTADGVLLEPGVLVGGVAS